MQMAITFMAAPTPAFRSERSSIVCSPRKKLPAQPCFRSAMDRWRFSTPKSWGASQLVWPVTRTFTAPAESTLPSENYCSRRALISSCRIIATPRL